MAIVNTPLDKKEHRPYTYLIGWRSLDLWYYGVRYGKGCNPCDLWVAYFTSSKRVADIRKKHGEPDVVQIRRVFASSVKAVAWESEVLRRTGAVKKSKWLNLARGGKEFNTSLPDVRESISRAKMGHETSVETRRKIGEASRGRVHSDEARLKISEASKGMVKSVETRARMSASRTGIVFSEETKAKMRTAATCRKASDITLARRKATMAAKRCHADS